MRCPIGVSPSRPGSCWPPWPGRRRRGQRAEALAALAWMAWWVGEAARARLLCDLALRDCPGHRLAALVEQLLSHAVPPPWLTQVAASGPPPDRVASSEW